MSAPQTRSGRVTKKPDWYVPEPEPPKKKRGGDGGTGRKPAAKKAKTATKPGHKKATATKKSAAKTTTAKKTTANKPATKTAPKKAATKRKAKGRKNATNDEDEAEDEDMEDAPANDDNEEPESDVSQNNDEVEAEPQAEPQAERPEETNDNANDGAGPPNNDTAATNPSRDGPMQEREPSQPPVHEETPGGAEQRRRDEKHVTDDALATGAATSTRNPTAPRTPANDQNAGSEPSSLGQPEDMGIPAYTTTLTANNDRQKHQTRTKAQRAEPVTLAQPQTSPTFLEQSPTSPTGNASGSPTVNNAAPETPRYHDLDGNTELPTSAAAGPRQSGANVQNVPQPPSGSANTAHSSEVPPSCPPSLPGLHRTSLTNRLSPVNRSSPVRSSPTRRSTGLMPPVQTPGRSMQQREAGGSNASVVGAESSRDNSLFGDSPIPPADDQQDDPTIAMNPDNAGLFNDSPRRTSPARASSNELEDSTMRADPGKTSLFGDSLIQANPPAREGQPENGTRAGDNDAGQDDEPFDPDTLSPSSCAGYESGIARLEAAAAGGHAPPSTQEGGSSPLRPEGQSRQSRLNAIMERIRRSQHNVNRTQPSSPEQTSTNAGGSENAARPASSPDGNPQDSTSFLERGIAEAMADQTQVDLEQGARQPGHPAQPNASTDQAAEGNSVDGETTMLANEVQAAFNQDTTIMDSNTGATTHSAAASTPRGIQQTSTDDQQASIYKRPGLTRPGLRQPPAVQQPLQPSADEDDSDLIPNPDLLPQSASTLAHDKSEAERRRARRSDNTPMMAGHPSRQPRDSRPERQTQRMPTDPYLFGAPPGGPPSRPPQHDMKPAQQDTPDLEYSEVMNSTVEGTENLRYEDFMAKSYPNLLAEPGQQRSLSEELREERRRLGPQADTILGTAGGERREQQGSEEPVEQRESEEPRGGDGNDEVDYGDNDLFEE